MSHHLDLSGMKKRKRGERVFKLKAFGENGYPVEFIQGGSFEQNVRALLEFGQMEIGLCDPLPCWSFQLEVHRHPLLHVFLLVVEEPIHLSFSRCCKHCQYIGWGEHLICNKKYHFLLPSKDTISAHLSYEGHFSMSSFPAAAIATCKSNLIELQGHTLHGVFHSNGFGHLLCVNGLETGSDLPGHQIMDFWDRLCTGLKAREVSLKDVSQKNGMDLRLLHGVAYGRPWCGQWGYKFGRGSFGVTQSTYQNAIESMRTIPLALFTHHHHHLGNNDQIYNEVITTLSRYQMLSGNILVNLGDMFHFMLELKSKLPKESSTTTTESSHSSGLLVDTSCRWSPKRIEMAIRVIIEALKRAEFQWISRQEVRDAARAYIGDTGLLDFVLKSLGNHIVGKYLVRRCLNPVTKVLEYCLEDISDAFPQQDHQGYGRIIRNRDSKSTKPQYNNITLGQLMKDVFRLYKHILIENKPILAHVPMASRIVLDTKFFIKNYSDQNPLFTLENSGIIGSISLINIKNGGGADSVSKLTIDLCEYLTVKNSATFYELQVEMERRFRDLYWGLRNFVVQSIPNVEAQGSDMVFNIIKRGSKVIFEGEIVGEEEATQDQICGYFENYDGKMVVDCSCGTKRDDGERMVACDICEVWQHTRCVNIPSMEEIPTIFLCHSCEQGILHFPSLP
ncbi:OLC1v1033140C1 [Oldenlandia corymbosa var. corymbosa]|uniref:OLC1v1033140C1 n=1 Tax=Oldenlandia corymbosa var. corymbosa TaxID=529605 RepID=A0AAV1CQB7_OLDCO|nr:OLC1v1033140C1 [Oldenlandia corymbosa var. corymbosa]